MNGTLGEDERDRVYEQQRRPEVEGDKQGNRMDKT